VNVCLCLSVLCLELCHTGSQQLAAPDHPRLTGPVFSPVQIRQGRAMFCGQQLAGPADVLCKGRTAGRVYSYCSSWLGRPSPSQSSPVQAGRGCCHQRVLLAGTAAYHLLRCCSRRLAETTCPCPDRLVGWLDLLVGWAGRYLWPSACLRCARYSLL
jgi:hypothetical protein